LFRRKSTLIAQDSTLNLRHSILQRGHSILIPPSAAGFCSKIRHAVEAFHPVIARAGHFVFICQRSRLQLLLDELDDGGGLFFREIPRDDGLATGNLGRDPRRGEKATIHGSGTFWWGERPREPARL
jgi:hypothetical protein